MFEEKFIAVLKKKCYIFRGISLEDSNMKIEKETNKDIPTELEVQIIIKILKMSYDDVYFINKGAYALSKHNLIEGRDIDTLYFKKLNARNPKGILILLSKKLEIEEFEIRHVSDDLYYYWNLRKKVRDLLEIKNRESHREGDIGEDAIANIREQDELEIEIESLKNNYKKLFTQKIISKEGDTYYLSKDEINNTELNIHNSLEDYILKEIEQAKIVINYEPRGEEINTLNYDFYPRKNENLFNIYYKDNIENKKIIFDDAISILNQYEYNENYEQKTNSREILDNSKYQKKINPKNFFLLREKIASAEQSSIHLSKNKILLIEGAAGTGKTTTAVTHIKKILIDNKKLSSKDIVFLVNTESGMKYLKDFANELKLKEISIFDTKKFIQNILNKNKVSQDIINIFIEEVSDINKKNLEDAEKFSLNYLSKMNLITTPNDYKNFINYLLKKYSNNLEDVVISYELKGRNKQLNTLREVDRIKFEEIKTYLENKKSEEITKCEKLKEKIKEIESDIEIVNLFFRYSKETINFLKNLKERNNIDSLKRELQELIRNNDFSTSRFTEITNKLREIDFEENSDSILTSSDKKRILKNIKNLNLNFSKEFYIKHLAFTVFTLELNKGNKNILYLILDKLNSIDENKLENIAFESIEKELKNFERLVKDKLVILKEEKEKENRKIEKDVSNLKSLLESGNIDIEKIVLYSRDPYWLFRNFISANDEINENILNYLFNILSQYDSILYFTKLLLGINRTEISVLLSVIYSMNHLELLNKYKVIFIDEIQDYTPFEIEICRIFSGEKLILAGDQLQRTTFVKNGIKSWEDIYKYETLYRDNLFELSLNFRQTYELANASLNFRKKILNKKYVDIKKDYFENQIGFYKPMVVFMQSNNILDIMSSILFNMAKKYENIPPIALVTSNQEELEIFKGHIKPKHSEYYLIEKNGKYNINTISSKRFIFMDISNIKGKEFPIIVYWIPKGREITDNIIYLIMSRANFEVYILVENTNSLTSNFKSFFNESEYLECKI